jgi:hypothetical protein
MPHQPPRVPDGEPAAVTASPEPDIAGFPRAARWDTATVLRQLARVAGVMLTDAGRCQGGEVGAAYVRWPDGHLSVLTAGPPGAAAVTRAAELAGLARTAGVPAPRYELIAELPGIPARGLELLPGTPPAASAPLSAATVEGMIALNGRLGGLLAGRADLPPPSLYLRSDGPGFCLHEPAARYSRDTAALLADIEEVGARVPEHLEGADLVHFDFHPENVLTGSAGEVTGVVDWDGASRSHGGLDLMTLAFDLARRAPGLLPLVSRELRQVPARVALACWAHMSLRLVDWSIREHGPADVQAWLGVAARLRP